MINPNLGKSSRSLSRQRLSAALEAAKSPLRETVEAVPVRFQRTVYRALAKQASPAQAIKAKCLECVGYEDAESRIRECNVTRCSLRAYRPYQGE